MEIRTDTVGIGTNHSILGHTYVLSFESDKKTNKYDASLQKPIISSKPKYYTTKHQYEWGFSLDWGFMTTSIDLRWRNSATRTIDFLPQMKSQTTLKLGTLLAISELKNTKACEIGLASFFLLLFFLLSCYCFFVVSFSFTNLFSISLFFFFFSQSVDSIKCSRKVVIDMYSE